MDPRSLQVSVRRVDPNPKQSLKVSINWSISPWGGRAPLRKVVKMPSKSHTPNAVEHSHDSDTRCPHAPCRLTPHRPALCIASGAKARTHPKPGRDRLDRLEFCGMANYRLIDSTHNTLRELPAILELNTCALRNKSELTPGWFTPQRLSKRSTHPSCDVRERRLERGLGQLDQPAGSRSRVLDLRDGSCSAPRLVPRGCPPLRRILRSV